MEAALELRSSIVGIMLRKADELARVNQELSRSNVELDAFAYIASHDLKEPLRGIYNYSSFLIEDYGSVLDEAGGRQIKYPNAFDSSDGGSNQFFTPLLTFG